MDAAKDIVGCGALLYVCSKMHDTNYSGPSVLDLVEAELVTTLPSPIQVFVRVGGLYRTAIVRDNCFPIYQTIVKDLCHTNFYMSWNGKPITVDSNPIELGITEGATIVCTIRLCGGSFSRGFIPLDQNPLFLTQSMSVEIERLVIRKHCTAMEWLDLPLPLNELQSLAQFTHEEIVNKIRLFEAEVLQSDHDTDQAAARNWRTMTHYIAVGLKRMESMRLFPGFNGGFAEIFEGLMILRHWHRTCSNLEDYYTLARTAYMCLRVSHWLLPFCRNFFLTRNCRVWKISQRQCEPSLTHLLLSKSVVL